MNNSTLIWKRKPLQKSFEKLYVCANGISPLLKISVQNIDHTLSLTYTYNIDLTRQIAKK